jgi:hypothetical protein
MTTSGKSSGHGVFAVIRDRAFRAFRPDRLGQTNLYLDQRVIAADEQLGPAFQRLTAPRASVLVFLGERAAIEQGRRTATVRAVTDWRIVTYLAADLPARDLQELAAGHYRENQ